MNARETEALVFERTGPPAEVVTLRSIPLPEMGRADAPTKTLPKEVAQR